MNYFNLTPCKKMSLRRRTICSGEPTVWYHTYFEPKNLNKHERRYAIDSFKHPKNEEEQRMSDEMLCYALTEFFKVHDVNEFDTILGIPSSSNIVKKTIDSIVSAGFKGNVIYKGFRKTRIRNVKLKTWIIDREKSIKTKHKVPQSFNRSRKLHYDKVSKSSLFPTRFRRYVENLLELNFNRGTLGGPSGIKDADTIFNKKVLVVDDTVGEGFTLTESVRLLKPYTKHVVGFTVMKDIANNTKTKKYE